METKDYDFYKIIKGQKFIIIGILVNIAFIIIKFLFGSFIDHLSIVGLALAIYGIVVLIDGLDYKLWLALLLSICMFIPVLSIVVLVVLNGMAVKVLASHGYKIGFMGAKPKWKN